MLRHINNKGIEFNADEYAKSKEVMHTQIKAFIARNLWGSTAFYMIINDLNEIYNESVLKMKEGWKL